MTKKSLKIRFESALEEGWDVVIYLCVVIIVLFDIVLWFKVFHLI